MTTKYKIFRQLKAIVYILLPLIGGSWVGVSCSEDTAEVDEYENWQVRNEAYFATLEDSLKRDPAAWKKLKCYSLDENTQGQVSDYIYAKVIKSGTETTSPMFTDSVRVSYEGRTIPTVNYPEGYIFNGTVYGSYNEATNSNVKFVMVASGSEALLSGWVTALLHMHRGDYWRIYIPSALGYGSQDKTSIGIPPYSTLIFDLTLLDFSPVGQVMKPYNAPRRY